MPTGVEFRDLRRHVWVGFDHFDGKDFLFEWIALGLSFQELRDRTVIQANGSIRKANLREIAIESCDRVVFKNLQRDECFCIDVERRTGAQERLPLMCNLRFPK